MAPHKPKSLDNIPDVIYCLSTDGRFLEMSAGVEAMLGYKADEMIGQSAFDFIVADDLARVQQSFREAVETHFARDRALQAPDAVRRAALGT